MNLLKTARPLFCVTTIFLTHPAFSDDHHQDHVIINETEAIGLLAVDTRDRILNAIDGKFSNLIALVAANTNDDERLLDAMRSQHQSWIKYKVDECELVGNLNGGTSPWRSVRAMQCEVALQKQRYEDISNALDCVSKLTSAKDPANELALQDCLQPLTPLYPWWLLKPVKN